MNLADRITVADRYNALVDGGEIERDDAQERLVQALDNILTDIRERRLGKKSSNLGWLFARKKQQQQLVRGLYIHGGVGRGKTMLMDLFYEQVAAQRKRRVHFHDFMADVHERINQHRQALKRGETKQEDPIPPVASQLIADAWVLCFDEFSVTDIADAMILGRLFEALFERGIVIVATSNRPPDDLYRDGLNRQLFVPFIDMLKVRVDVHELESITDYRQGREAGQSVYFHPLGADARASMDAAWKRETGGEASAPLTLSIRGRRVRIAQATEDAGRASFADLCEKPLGPADYLAVAEQFPVFFLDDIPQLTWAENNEAKRLVTLIDAFYEAKTRLYCSADAAPEDLYTEGKGAFEFARTASRLAEMQGADWGKE